MYASRNFFNSFKNLLTHFATVRSGWSMTGGRPSKLKLLFTHRRKHLKLKRVMFHKKRGRKPDEHIHWNSLIRRPGNSRCKRPIKQTTHKATKAQDAQPPPSQKQEPQRNEVSNRDNFEDPQTHAANNNSMVFNLAEQPY